MALTTAEVATYTKGRLDAGDSATQVWLDRGLATARRWCGWQVTPVVDDDVVTLDGPGSRLLVLPTLKLVELTAVDEDGTGLDVADLAWSSRGLVRKKSGACWSAEYGSIVVTMTHGFGEAKDFDLAVLSVIDRISLAPDGGRPVSVGPFRWSEDRPEGGAFTAAEQAMLEQYRLESPA